MIHKASQNILIKIYVNKRTTCPCLLTWQVLLQEVVHHAGHGRAVDALADALVTAGRAENAVTLRLGRVKAIDELVKDAKKSAATLARNEQDEEAKKLFAGATALRASRVHAIRRLGETCLAAGQVEAEDDPPVADDQTRNGIGTDALTLTLTASDVENDPLTFEIVDAPLYGTLSGEAPALVCIRPMPI